MQAQIWFVLALAVCQWSIHLTTANDPEELETRVELSAELNDEMGALEELQQAPAIANEPSGEPEILDELPGESTKDLGEDDKSRQGRQTNTDEVNKEAVATSDEPREELKSEKKILGELKEEMGADEKLQQAPGVTIDSRSGPETHKDKHEDSEEPSHGEQMGADDGMQQTLPDGNEPNGPPPSAPDETPDNKTPWVLEREKRLAELKWRMDMDWELQRPLILLNVGEPEPEEAKRAIDKVIELIEKYKKENGGELPVYYDIAFWNYSCIRGDCESAKRGFQMSVNRILHASEPLPWQKITKDSTHIPGYITVFPNLRKYFRHYCLKKYYEDFENKTEAPPAKSWFTKLYSNPLDDKTSGPWNKLTTMNIEKKQEPGA